MKDEYIGLRLGIAFSLLIAILVGVGWLGLSRMGRINADMEEIVNKRWAKVQLAREAMSYSNLNNRITFEILLLKDREEINPLLVRRAENSERISALIGEIGSRVESGKEKELLAAVNAARWPYVNSYKHAFGLLLEEHKPEEAREAMVRGTLPELIKYHEVWDAFVVFEGGQMDEAARASAKNYAAARRLALSLIAVAVVLATSIAGFTTRSLIAKETQREQAEAALRESEERARLLLDSAAEAIYVINLEGKCTFCNRAGLRMLGYRETSDLLKKNMHQLIHHTRPDGTPYPAEQCRIYQAFRRGEEMHMDDEILWRADGSSFPVELWSYPTRRGGNVVGAVVTFVDISERKRAEIHLRQAKEAAEAANRAKSEFLANMSHEIRTPLNGVIGMTDLALETGLTPEQREYLETIKISADSLLTVINDILDFSKIEAGKLDFDAVDFSLRDTLGDTMKTLGLRAHQKGLELTYQVRQDVPDALVGDPGRLRQIVVNLVGNAIKFTQRGEVVVDVEAESQTEDAVDLRLAITDTGMGIPLDKQRAIFDPFTQADGSMTRKFGGTGLGLTIASRLVEGMGGRIWVESEPGKGSAFHFTARLGLQKALALRPRPAEPAHLRDLSVLVVDDNATNCRILDQMLKSWRMRPTAVEGGHEALAVLEQTRTAGRTFPLILLDAQMPGMDGFALVERMKQIPELTGATIMMLTSAGQRGDAARCRELGIAGYLTKPIKQSELLQAILLALGTPAKKQARPPLVTRHVLRESRQRLRILLAEDNAVNQTLVVRLLEKWGHAVTVAGDGRAALAALEKTGFGGFDLVLMDVQLPEMDGLEATAAIRAKEKSTGGSIPIIAMTAHTMKGDRERCLAAGMDGYISKPVQAQELFEAVENISHRAVVTRAAEPAEKPAEAALGEAILPAQVGRDR